LRRDRDPGELAGDPGRPLRGAGTEGERRALTRGPGVAAGGRERAGVGAGMRDRPVRGNAGRATRGVSGAGGWARSVSVAERGERVRAGWAGSGCCASGGAGLGAWALSRGGLKRSRPGGARASWAEVGPREGRGRPGPRWAGPGLLLGWVLVVGLGLGWVEGLGFLFPILLLSKSNSNKV